jgi:two-component system cell cycle sensor histidine kinase/response regulator CckA
MAGRAVSDPAATVLIVEGDEASRAVIETALRGGGFAVIGVAGYVPALALLDGPQAVDLLLTDIEMPGIHGLALGRMALVRRPRLKIIYLTARAPGAAVQEASGPILAKPVTGDQLLEEVARQLAAPGEPRA